MDKMGKKETATLSNQHEKKEKKEVEITDFTPKAKRIIYRAMKELSGMKHLYMETVVGCIESMINQFAFDQPEECIDDIALFIVSKTEKIYNG